MNDILLGGPPIPLYDIDDIIVESSEFDNHIYDIINLLKSNYELSDEKIKLAYQAFVDATGYNQNFLENNANIIKDTQLALTNANILYVSLLIGITLIIMIWALCLLGLFNWIVAIILTVVIIFFIVILSFAYSSKCNTIINDETSKLKNQNQLSSENVEGSIAHWPKGLYEILRSIIDEPKINEVKEVNEVNEVKEVNDQINNIELKGCGCGK
jgi:ABC-type multidrug transport system fused ATPase/permease subunit